MNCISPGAITTPIFWGGEQYAERRRKSAPGSRAAEPLVGGKSPAKPSRPVPDDIALRRRVPGQRREPAHQRPQPDGRRWRHGHQGGVRRSPCDASRTRESHRRRVNQGCRQRWRTSLRRREAGCSGQTLPRSRGSSRSRSASPNMFTLYTTIGQAEAGPQSQPRGYLHVLASFPTEHPSPTGNVVRIDRIPENSGMPRTR